jgi:hypothetical protein
MYLFSESRELLRVKVVNIGAVLRACWLILGGDLINYKLERFYSANDIWLN